MKSILTVAFLLIGTSAMAAVQSDDAKVGVQLDSTGVIMSGLNQKPLPLPPGKWKIVGRIDHDMGLTNRNTGDSKTPMVALTLINEEKASPVVAAMIDYPSDRLTVRYSNSECADVKAQYVETFGTTTGSIKYACVLVYSHRSDSFKSYILGQPNSKSQFWKERFLPLVEYADSLPGAYNWNYFKTNLDRGRTMTAVLITTVPPSVKAEEPVDEAAKSFAKSAGQAFLNWVSNEDAAIPAYPAQ